MAAKIATWMKRRRVVKVGSPAVLAARRARHLWRRRCLSDMFCGGGCSTFCADISSCLGAEEPSASDGQNRTRRTIVCTLYSYEMKWMLLAMTSSYFQLPAGCATLRGCAPPCLHLARAGASRCAQRRATWSWAAKVHSPLLKSYVRTYVSVRRRYEDLDHILFRPLFCLRLHPLLPGRNNEVAIGNHRPALRLLLLVKEILRLYPREGPNEVTLGNHRPTLHRLLLLKEILRLSLREGPDM